MSPDLSPGPARSSPPQCQRVILPGWAPRHFLFTGIRQLVTVEVPGPPGKPQVPARREHPLSGAALCCSLGQMALRSLPSECNVRRAGCTQRCRLRQPGTREKRISRKGQRGRNPGAESWGIKRTLPGEKEGKDEGMRDVSCLGNNNQTN